MRTDLDFWNIKEPLFGLIADVLSQRWLGEREQLIQRAIWKDGLKEILENKKERNGFLLIPVWVLCRTKVNTCWSVGVLAEMRCFFGYARHRRRGDSNRMRQGLPSPLCTGFLAWGRNQGPRPHQRKKKSAVWQGSPLINQWEDCWLQEATTEFGVLPFEFLREIERTWIVGFRFFYLDMNSVIDEDVIHLAPGAEAEFNITEIFNKILRKLVVFSLNSRRKASLVQFKSAFCWHLWGFWGTGCAGHATTPRGQAARDLSESEVRSRVNDLALCLWNFPAGDYKGSGFSKHARINRQGIIFTIWRRIPES